MNAIHAHWDQLLAEIKIPDLDPVDILKYGAIGLIFLLAFMAYDLLRREQMKAEPSGTMLKGIRSYLSTIIVLVIIAAAIEVWGRFYDHKQLAAENERLNTQHLEDIANTAKALKAQEIKMTEAMAGIRQSHDVAITSLKSGYDAEKHRLNTELTAVLGDRQRLTLELGDVRTKLNGAESGLAVADTWMKSLRSLTGAGRSPDEMVKWIGNSLAELERLRPLPARLDALVAENTKLSGELANCTQKLARISGAVPGTVSDATEFVLSELRELKELRPKHQALQLQNTDVTARFEEQGRQWEKLQVRVGVLSGELATATEANRQLTVRIAGLERELEEWRLLARQLIARPPQEAPATASDVKVLVGSLRSEAGKLQALVAQKEQRLVEKDVELNQARTKVEVFSPMLREAAAIREIRVGK